MTVKKYYHIGIAVDTPNGLIYIVCDCVIHVRAHCKSTERSSVFCVGEEGESDRQHQELQRHVDVVPLGERQHARGGADLNLVAEQREGERRRSCDAHLPSHV